jgi:hypothetical protein
MVFHKILFDDVFRKNSKTPHARLLPSFHLLLCVIQIPPFLSQENPCTKTFYQFAVYLQVQVYSS